MKSQERDLNALREKLSEMSTLVAKKDRELKAAAAELRYEPPGAAGLLKLTCRFPAGDCM